MVVYQLGIENPHNRYIQFTVSFDHLENEYTDLQLPRWRPGRYELGNFSKNIQKFEARDQENELLPVQKISKDCWRVKNGSAKKLTVTYNYYASELNAGSSYLDTNQLYVNPVNCFIYRVNKMDEKCTIELNVPANYKIATGLDKLSEHILLAQDFQELADSPFIASAQLQQGIYEVENTTFNIWLMGQCKPDWEKVKKDFYAFTKKQFDSFGDFPFKEYHFLIQVAVQKAYHGVEHLNSTVLHMGPGYDLFTERNWYNELMGLACHELYHAWNIKQIRPKDMLPYDLTQENYSTLGFIYEGVTTYYGDLFLLKSGYFSEKEYYVELSRQFKQHFDNYGRFNLSVADSSFDNWLDGYDKGTPNRKVSIYTEGCLLAFMTDVYIMKQTKNQYSLLDVMRKMYEDFGVKSIGYALNDYKSIIENLTGNKWNDFFENFVLGTEEYKDQLNECLDYIGLSLDEEPSDFIVESKFGMKTDNSKTLGEKILSVAPNSISEKAGLTVDDEIIAINNYVINNDLNRWFKYFSNQNKHVLYRRRNRIYETDLVESDQNYYMRYSVYKIENVTAPQQGSFEIWSKK
jgi:predicted metalloprotease with PDZ domain